MAPIPQGGTVAVTGSAGFIGGWVVRQLLDEGYRVRACVRDTNDEDKAGFLKAMPGYASGRLTLHSANLDEAGCFDEIFRGCHGVAHLSHVSTYDDLDYVKKVCDHVINSVNQSETVNRVIVTSSIAAVISEQDIQELVRRPVLYEDRYPDEQNPKRLPERGQGYSMGKVLAERAFADAAEASGRWDAITCCPGDNVGPIQSAHQKNGGPWQHHIETMLLGKYTQNVIGAYRAWYTVEVRDVAEAIYGCWKASMSTMASDLSLGQQRPETSKMSAQALIACSLSSDLPVQNSLIRYPKVFRPAKQSFARFGEAVNYVMIASGRRLIWIFDHSMFRLGTVSNRCYLSPR